MYKHAEGTFTVALLVVLLFSLGYVAGFKGGEIIEGLGTMARSLLGVGW